MTKTGAAARPSATLEPETLAETFQTYQRQIAIGAILVVAAAGGIWMWRRSSEIKETRAAEAYAAAEAAFGAGNPQLAQPELEKAITRFSGTTGGTQSSMLLARILFDQGKYAEGLEKLNQALGGAPTTLRSAVQALIGAGQEAAGKPAEAATAFERAAEAASFQEDREMYRMEAARNHLEAGNASAAKSIYEAITAREDSPYVGEAKVRLGELTTKQ